MATSGAASLHDLVLRTPQDEIDWCLLVPGMLYYCNKKRLVFVERARPED